MSAYLRFFTKLYIQRHFRYQDNVPLVSYLNDQITHSIFLNGRHENEELDVLEEYIFPILKKSAVCLDIGAHIGNHSLCFSRYFDKVYSFEPHPQTFELLKINTSFRTNVVPVNKGCSKFNCTLFATQIDESNSGGTRIQKSSSSAELHNIVEFNLEALDEIEMLKKAESIDFMKVDAEGHEYECFCGATKLLEKHSPVIVCEVEEQSLVNGTSPAIDYLRQNGYRFMYELEKVREGSIMRNLIPVLTSILTNKRKKIKLKLKWTNQLTFRYHRMVVFSKYSLDKR